MALIEEYELKTAYLHGRIETLEFLLKVLVATLPEEQRGYVLRRLSEFTRYTEEDAARTDTDPARDVASAVYNTNEYFKIRVCEEVEILLNENEE